MAFGDENGNDTRCKVCGPFFYSVVRDGTFRNLVDDPTIRPTQHIFVDSKARWFTITDDLPQYDEHVVVAGPAGGQALRLLPGFPARRFGVQPRADR